MHVDRCRWLAASVLCEEATVQASCVRRGFAGRVLWLRPSKSAGGWGVGLVRRVAGAFRLLRLTSEDTAVRRALCPFDVL